MCVLLQPDDSTNVLQLGYCAPISGAPGAQAQSGVVTAWTRNALPAPLAFFPLANNLQSPTLPSYIGLNEGAIFVGDASFGQALSCDKVSFTLCRCLLWAYLLRLPFKPATH